MCLHNIECLAQSKPNFNSKLGHWQKLCIPHAPCASCACSRLQKLKLHVCICAHMCSWLCDCVLTCARDCVLILLWSRCELSPICSPSPPSLCLPRRVNGAPVHWGIMALATWHGTHYMNANAVCTGRIYFSDIGGDFLVLHSCMPSLQLDVLKAFCHQCNGSICHLLHPVVW